jgi:hypothetical protein
MLWWTNRQPHAMHEIEGSSCISAVRQQRLASINEQQKETQSCVVVFSSSALFCLLLWLYHACGQQSWPFHRVRVASVPCQPEHVTSALHMAEWNGVLIIVEYSVLCMCKCCGYTPANCKFATSLLTVVWKPPGGMSSRMARTCLYVATNYAKLGPILRHASSFVFLWDPYVHL